MTMQYIREHYDQRLKRGVKVQVRWHGKLYEATVVGSSDSYLRVRLHPQHRPLLFHPNDIEKILLDDAVQTEYTTTPTGGQ